MSDEEARLPLPIRPAGRVSRRATLGALAAFLAGGPVAAAPPPARLRLATFSADVTPPLGHALMGGGIAPAREVLDPLFARGFVLLGAGPPVLLAAIDWCEIRNDAFDRWREALAEAADTEPRHVMLTSLHQHDAPIADLAAQRLLDGRHSAGSICDPDFHERAVQGVARAVREGLKSTRPVTTSGRAGPRWSGSRRTAATSGRTASPRSTA